MRALSWLECCRGLRDRHRPQPLKGSKARLGRGLPRSQSHERGLRSQHSHEVDSRRGRPGISDKRLQGTRRFNVTVKKVGDNEDFLCLLGFTCFHDGRLWLHQNIHGQRRCECHITCRHRHVSGHSRLQRGNSKEGSCFIGFHQFLTYLSREPDS